MTEKNKFLVGKVKGVKKMTSWIIACNAASRMERNQSHNIYIFLGNRLLKSVSKWDLVDC